MKPIFFALGRIRAGCTLASSLVLVALAWFQTKEPQGDARRLFARRVATGMSLGLGGDILMAGGVLLAAMTVFGAGHFFYMRAMLGLATAERIEGKTLRSADKRLGWAYADSKYRAIFAARRACE